MADSIALKPPGETLIHLGDSNDLSKPEETVVQTEAAGEENLVKTEVPVENSDSESTEGKEISTVSAGVPSLTELMAQPLVRRALPGLIGLFALLFFISIYVWLNSGTTRALYPNMSEVDRGEAFNQLLDANIAVTLDDQRGTLMVPSDDYYAARMLLATNGLPTDANTQVLDTLSTTSSMTTSQFMEQAQYVAAIEIELSKSIVQISTIQAARVHLAAPRQSSYIRNREPAKASVVVTSFPGRVVSPAQVQAIVNIVASSVPYLSLDDVSVVDQLGNLLTDKDNSALQEASEQAAFKRTVEDDYSSKIIDLLTPIFGRENIRSDVDVTLNFSEFESTSEIFDRAGTGPKARSEILILDTSSTTPATGVPGSTSNVAPADTVLVENNNVDADGVDTLGVRSSQTTRNYEVDREIQYQKNSSGDVTKLTVAVVLNRDAISGDTLTGDGTDDVYDTAPIQNLVARAVGIDEGRGDSIMVLVSQFRDDGSEVEMAWYESASVMAYSKMILIAICFLAVVLFVIRPLVRGLIRPAIDPALLEAASDGSKTNAKGEVEADSESAAEGSSEEDTDEDDEEFALDEGELLIDGTTVLRTKDEVKAYAEETGETLEEIKARLKPRKSNISADMLDTANTYDDKVAIVRMLVDEDSSRVASLLKKMVAGKQS
jgi:flagellar M-ring protein FliF